MMKTELGSSDFHMGVGILHGFWSYSDKKEVGGEGRMKGTYKI